MKTLVLFFVFIPAIFAQDSGSAEPPGFFLVLMDRGPAYNPSKPPSGQKNFSEHAAFMNKLEKAGKIFGGPLLEIEDKQKVAGALMIIAASDTNQVRALLKDEPLLQNRVLKLNVIRRFIPAVNGIDFTN